MAAKKTSGTVAIGSKPVTQAQWKSGALLRALQPAAPAPTVTPTPATPAAPAGPQALPVDPAYDAAIGAAQKTRDTTLAGQQAQRQQQLGAYGYSEDPTSGALTFNPNDAFAKASLLKQSYDTSRARTGQVMGSTGGLYQGAYQNAQDLLNRNQLQAEDSLQKSLLSWLSQNTMAQATTGTNYDASAAQALSDRMGRIPTNPLYSPSDAIDAATAAAAPAAAAPVKTPATPAKTIKAGPSVKATKDTTVKKSTKGKTVTYTTSVKRA